MSTRQPRLWMIALAAAGLTALAQPAPAGATSQFMATIDGAQMDPPNNSFC